MFRGLRYVAVALAILFIADPAMAQLKPGNRFPGVILRRNLPQPIQPNFPLLMPVTPSQAAAIAQSQVPGSRVVKVKLRGDVYAVRLSTAGSVMVILVSALDGTLL